MKKTLAGLSKAMITPEKINILKNELNLDLSFEKLEKLKAWHKIFIDYNSHTNLMSKNDVSVVFEKHVYDSLAILLWKNFEPHKETKILDVGTGGGFPSVILAICFDKLKIIANDSRSKKINFINLIKTELSLTNIETLCGRIEEIPALNCDTVLSRAVGKIQDVWNISQKHLKQGGSFVIYKAKNVSQELKNFKNYEIYPYSLPLDEHFERNLVVIKKY